MVRENIPYLGTIMDGRLRFDAHFDRLIPKVEGVASLLRRLLPNVGGLVIKMRRLYMQIIKSCVYMGPLYGLLTLAEPRLCAEFKVG